MERDALDTILALIEELEKVLMGLRQLRSHIGKGVGANMVEVLADDVEKCLAKVKHRVVQ